MILKSTLIAQGSGSIGGVTWSHNAGGQYLRARVIPTNPGTMRQNAARTAFATLVNAWSSDLSVGERDGWTHYADNVPMTNRLGEQFSASGLNWYVKCNVPRLVALADRVDTAPTILSLAPCSPLTIQAATDGSLTVDFTDGDQWAGETGGILFLMWGQGVIATRNFFKGPYAYTGKIVGDTTTPVTTGESVTRVSGSAAMGQDGRVFWKAAASLADGRVSAYQTGFDVAT